MLNYYCAGVKLSSSLGNKKWGGEENRMKGKKEIKNSTSSFTNLFQDGAT